jgi:iron complex transport system substrate-binding protein
LGTLTLPMSRRVVVGLCIGLAAGLVRQRVLAQLGTPVASPASGEWTFTDDRGVVSTLAEMPQRIVAFSPIAGALWDLGIAPIGVFGPLSRAYGSPDPQVGNLDVTKVTWLGDWDGFDLEIALALQADLLVGLELPDVPDTLWYVPAELYPAVSSQMATAGFRPTPEKGVPWLFDRVEDLAVALGADLEAVPQVEARGAFDTAVADFRAAVAAKPGPRVLVVSADTESLYVANSEWFDDLAFFRSLGLDILKPQTEERWEILSWEEASRYQPDLYLVDARSGEVPPELAQIPT